MKTIISILGGIIFQASFGALARMEVVVVDDDTGEPMTNVTVRGIFPIDNGWMAFKGVAPPNVDVGKTDGRGRCKLSGTTNRGRAWCEVEDLPPEYYEGCGAAFEYNKSILGVWLPSDQVMTIRVNKKKKAIPLHVKYMGSRGVRWSEVDLFAVAQGKLQLDLMKGDWLPPAGTGEVADIEFERTPREVLGEVPSPGGGMAEVWREGMKVRFPGEGNGWVEVRPENASVAVRTSPDHGFTNEYKDVWIERNRDLQIVRSRDKKKLVCFRIRTKMDERGVVVGGYYGKIYEDIFFFPGTGLDVTIAAPEILYYLNPKPLDRNLEWDGQTNLFQDQDLEVPW
jgi:hypothetical protein